MQSLASAVQVGWYAGWVQEKENKFGILICFEEKIAVFGLTQGALGLKGRGAGKREI